MTGKPFRTPKTRVGAAEAYLIGLGIVSLVIVVVGLVAGVVA